MAESAPADAPEPEAAYEAARGKKVRQAVKEAKVKHGAETSGMFTSESHAESHLCCRHIK